MQEASGNLTFCTQVEEGAILVSRRSQYKASDPQRNELKNPEHNTKVIQTNKDIEVRRWRDIVLDERLLKVKDGVFRWIKIGRPLVDVQSLPS